MHGPTLRFAAILMITLAAAMIGCGGGSDNGGFDNCGNGVLDAGEECDDGNLLDQDACLGTCIFNVCGDNFLNLGVEQCDGVDFGDATCMTRGFAGGTLACTSSCTIDTSACSGTSGGPTPVVTATPTISPGTSGTQPTTTPTPTGGGPTCQSGDQIVAMLSVDQPYGGLSLRLAYPTAANIPGSGTAQSVKDRVVFAHAGGLTAVNDLDNSGDGVDDTLAASSVASDENPAGVYVTVTFDCLAGQSRPAASDFACSIQSASMPDGTEITDETCTVTVQ